MYELTEEGKKYLKEGLPEKNLLKILPKNIQEIKDKQIAIGWAKKNGWIEIRDGFVSLTDIGKKAMKIKTDIEIALEQIEKKGISDLNDILLKRKLIEQVKETKVHKPKGVLSSVMKLFEKIFHKEKTIEKKELKEISQLTPELIKSCKWKEIPFRNYDILAPAPKIHVAKKQPYIQFIEDFKEKLIALGFKEVRGPLVETSFWNSDVLFMPSDHPARGIHDILLLKKPRYGKLPDENFVSKIKATHEGGWITGSKGWGHWNQELAKQLVMRSQTTAVTARALKKYGDVPGKYFCIDRNYRRDVIDYKHLIEFDQFDGIIVGEKLNFRELLGSLKEFFRMIEINEVKFVPSYFPFTEPSCEIYANFPDKGWVEVGGAGMFRPEVIRPLGIEKSQVLAWGLGLGRIAMIKLGIKDIRDLYSDNLKWLREKEMVK
ncbi:MAG: phenylalanine--tRNA ligase subunit alpha [Candidatus Aenigmarchaeota archaeon]|nr:phenylalanine--tRNA ligase subunit alpha [Candidatus Aenigmarchaeota archaeon]